MKGLRKTPAEKMGAIVNTVYNNNYPEGNTNEITDLESTTVIPTNGPEYDYPESRPPRSRLMQGRMLMMNN